ncbi:BTAD domain-containing putative transcriptional regulator [Actinoplanes subtropicus]|uniref:BTAD domain-containing putative transcriptional regulator n=1 Tax=Actinoplanes subtropicus TaxID=543632 RepID=UPI0004C38BBF|nr:BTAD domain-containing putative transcriptional regulator [Actinoplanes subtropicus]
MLASLTSTLRRLTGATVLALLLAAPPWALLHYLDRPWPTQLPTWSDISTLLTSPMTDHTLGALLTALLWVAWAAFAWSALAELAAALTGLNLPQPRALAPARGLAALLVALITGGMLATAAQAAPGLSPPAQAAAASAGSHSAAQHRAPDRTLAPPRQAGPVSVVPVTVPLYAGPQHTQARDTSQTRTTLGRLTLVSADREYTYIVKHGDTLSEIAGQCLGDPNRWPEIYALNRGTHFADIGGTLKNPNLIYPGWTLHLPDDASPPHNAHKPTDPPNQGHPKPDPPQPASAASPPSSTHATTESTPTTPPPTTMAPGNSTAPATSPATTTDPGTTEPSSTAQPSPGPTHAATDHHTGPRGVALSTGSWIDLGLGLAIAAAVALVWKHRRRRYIPQPAGTRSSADDHDLAPMPTVVTQIRRGLRQHLPSPTDIAHATPLADPDDQDRDDDRGSDAGAGPAPGTHEQDTTDPDSDDGDEPAGPRPAPVPVVPALAHPLAAVWPPAGVGLIGPGATAAARGFFAAALAAGGLDDPDARTWVVMASTTAATLLGAAAVGLPHTPRLTVTAGLDEALDLLETQTLHRTRLVYQHEVDDVAALRLADPYEEPLPSILLIADTTSRHERTRVAALLTQGQRLDIHGVLLGDWPDGDTIDVAADGTTRPAERDATHHGTHPADVGRLTVIDPTEAADLITTLAESHTGRPQPPAPTDPHPTTRATDPNADHGKAASAATGEATPIPATGAGRHDPAMITEPAAAEPIGGPEPTLAREPAATAGPDTPTPGNGDASPGSASSDTTGDAEPTGIAPGRVEVTVLGGAAILDADPQRAPRPKSLELLVYLAANDGIATVDAILEDLLPDAPRSKAGHRLHTYVSDLRGVLRHNGGPGEYLSHPRLHYRLNPATVGVDLWQIRAAITEAAVADPDERIALLRRAVAAYRGVLAEGYDYLWIEPYREAVRRQALDATTTLIDALAETPEEQLVILGPAIKLHPYAETLYQAAMRAHARLGHLDDIRALRRAVTAVAAEIDVEPGDDTLTLADKLVADLQTRNPRMPLQPGPGGAA